MTAPTPAKRGPGRPKKITEPAVYPTGCSTGTTDGPVSVVHEPATLEDIIDSLLDIIGIDPRAVAGVDIRPQGIIRVIGTDRSARSVKFTPLPRYERDREGRIIE